MKLPCTFSLVSCLCVCVWLFITCIYISRTAFRRLASTTPCVRAKRGGKSPLTALDWDLRCIQMHFLFSECSKRAAAFRRLCKSLREKTGPRLLFWAFIKWSNPPSQGDAASEGCDFCSRRKQKIDLESSSTKLFKWRFRVCFFARITSGPPKYEMLLFFYVPWRTQLDFFCIYRLCVLGEPMGWKSGVSRLIKFDGHQFGILLAFLGCRQIIFIRICERVRNLRLYK